MRIAVITPFFPNGAEPYGGSPIYQTVLKLQELADVHVLCPRARYPQWRVLQPRHSFYKPLDQSYSPAGVAARWVEYPALPVVTRPFTERICARYLLPHVKAQKPEVILAYNVYPEGCAAVAVSERLGLPIVLGGRGNDLLRIPHQRARRLIRAALAKADFLLTVSEDMRCEAIALGASPERTRTVVNGCDTSVFRPRERQEARAELGVVPEARLILFVGRLSPVKGLEDLLRATASLLLSHSHLQLVLIGDDWMGATLQRLAEALGISGHVAFLGVRRADEIAAWLAACDVFCLPSYSEGCPNVVIEALSSGRPVVATHVGGTPELIDESCGLLVPPRQPESLAGALGQALARSWDAGAIATRFGRGWSAVARETYDACRAVLGAYSK